MTSDDMKRLSVAIGFKDWGLERLALTLRELVAQTNDLDGEVIVCDYGSCNGDEVESVVKSRGAVYVRTDDPEGDWSRACALNAAFAVSRGEVLVATDADMLFAPGSFEEILSHVEKNHDSFAILQCRDLPQQYDAQALADSEINWSELERRSHLRPRYGMGGMIAFPREAYLAVRGFDERMRVYGGEDIDFATRLRRAGYALHWLNGSTTRMYHVWHPSSRKQSESTAKGKQAVEYNSRILTEDETFIRNLKEWRHKPKDAKPLASIVICTRDRSDYILDSVYSSLAQTCNDIEVIVVDDGSTDDTVARLESIEDPRLTILKQPAKGIAAARNLAAKVTKSDFTVIFDDDDIMLPNRIEDHFKALVAGLDGTYGGWIDFKDTDEWSFTVNSGRVFSQDVIQYAGGVYLHPTLMLRTDLIRRVKYDETFRSGSDFNLASRLLRAGVKLAHSGRILILRRIHEKQVTHSDADYQRSSWATTRALGTFAVSKPQFDFIKTRELREATPVVDASVDPQTLIKNFGPNARVEGRVLLLRLDDAHINRTHRDSVTVVDAVNGSIVAKGMTLVNPKRIECLQLESAGYSVVNATGKVDDYSILLDSVWKDRPSGIEVALFAISPQLLRGSDKALKLSNNKETHFINVFFFEAVDWVALDKLAKECENSIVYSRSLR